MLGFLSRDTGRTGAGGVGVEIYLIVSGSGEWSTRDVPGWELDWDQQERVSDRLISEMPLRATAWRADQQPKQKPH